MGKTMKAKKCSAGNVVHLHLSCVKGKKDDLKESVCAKFAVGLNTFRKVTSSAWDVPTESL